CAPQADFPALGGSLVFTFADIVLTFPDMIVNTQAIRRNRSGLIWSLTLFDRRWKWNSGTGINGPISGSYNIRLDDDTLDPDRKRTPQQLAAICLDTMGEVGYDISQMPGNTYPPVNWDNEYPAQALQQICDQEGCRIVLQLDNTIVV